MDLDLAGRVVLVVGGTGLIGRAVVVAVRAEGATAIAAARGASADLTGAELRLDAGRDESVAAAIESIVAQHGRLDGVVITAAPSARTLDPARNGDPDQVVAAFEAKAMTFLRVANAVIPIMRAAGFGRIVGLSGQNAFVTGNITGSIRNTALIVAAKNLADGLAGTGVTVNTVSPGIVTPQPRATVEPGQPGDSAPDQVAALVTFLLSPRTPISGESIAIGHRVRGQLTL